MEYVLAVGTYCSTPEMLSQIHQKCHLIFHFLMDQSLPTAVPR